jgi:N6-L-threonylcarbamoyladenine synthase
VQRAGHLCEQVRADIARGFVNAVVDVLAAKSMAALEQTGLSTLVVAGGVGANAQLRERLGEEAAKRGVQLFFPPRDLCTDNGAMIALAGHARIQAGAGGTDGPFSIRPRWPLGT